MTKLRVVIAFLIFPGWLSAQQNTDRQQIETAIIGYIENFFINDYNSMEQHLHDQLSKRGINQNGLISEEYSKGTLKTLLNGKQALPLHLQANKVEEIYIDRHFAMAILETGYPNLKWKEYIHLAKVDEVWLIMNVFWNFDE